MRMLRYLLERGADPNALNNNGYTPAHFVVERDDKKVLEGLQCLENYHADFTIKNNSDETPLLLLMYVCVSKKFDYLNSAKYLIRKTLLHMSKKEDLETVQTEPILETLMKLFHEPLLRYYQQCVSEIVGMKSDIIFRDISVLKFVNAECSIDELATGGTSHALIINHILQQLAKNAYPAFCDALEELLSRRYLEMNLNYVNVSSTLTVSGGETEITLPSPCFLHVAQYLPNKDLLNLNLASYGTWKSDMIEFDEYSAEITDLFQKRKLPELSKWFQNVVTDDDSSDDDEYVPDTTSDNSDHDYLSDENGPENGGDDYKSDDDNGPENGRDDYKSDDENGRDNDVSDGNGPENDRDDYVSDVHGHENGGDDYVPDDDNACVGYNDECKIN